MTTMVAKQTDSDIRATILLVEDDAAILSGVAELLDIMQAEWGYQLDVLLAKDGVAALKTLDSSVPDLIVSDISMPRMDGYTFLSRVRMQPKLVHTPFIFLTAHGTQADISRGRTSGVERYIVKPFESAELLTLIKSQLDLSLRRKAYRQEVANRVRSAIFLMFQHELRTPTTFITAYTELLQDTLADLSPADMESVHEFIKGIQVGSRRLTDLIGWLQMVLDLHTGAYAARIQPESRQITGLSALLRATVASFETLANKHGITLYTDIPDNLPPVFGHAPSLTIVFEQLLDNAVKFTKIKQGVREISVTASAAGSGIFVSIRDSGIGFPNHARHDIFKLFSQHARAHQEQQGAGVGLTLVRSLVQLHHGTIEGIGAPDKGSTFFVRLPLYSAESTLDIEPPKALPVANILIAEDDPALLVGLQELLEAVPGNYAYQTLAARNGKIAFELLQQQPVDLILSDVWMPVVNGFQLLENIRSQKKWLDIPFIFLTAHDDALGAMKMGADEYIQKPYKQDELMALIDTRLARYFAQKAVVDDEFDILKYSILGTLPPDFLERLQDVTMQSNALLDIMQEPARQHDAHVHFASIQAHSGAIKQLVAEFTRLVEMMTGGFSEVFAVRAQPVFELARIVRDQVDRMVFSAESPPRITTNIPLKLPPVYGDSAALGDMLQRLLQHVATACAQQTDPHIHVSAQVNNGTVQVTIEGHSVTATAADVTHLAQLLADRASAPPATSFQDIKLLVARELCDLHNGSLTAQPLADGGYAFILKLDAHLAKSAP